MKTLFSKKPGKEERQHLALISLVELYLKTGKPVGSQTLKDSSIENVSPATLRNYFASLETSGYLKQHHASGGRIPTPLAYKAYAAHACQESAIEDKEKKALHQLLTKHTREVHLYLQQAAGILASSTQSATFLSSPRFDQDFIQEIKLVGIDAHRVLCVLLSDFGTIRSEIFLLDKKLSAFSLKRIDHFLHCKLSGLSKPMLSEEEEKIATKLYQEVMLRHLVGYSNFSANDIYKTGFSQMLSYNDFQDASCLASGLALFENDSALRSLLSSCVESHELRFFVGEDLLPHSPSAYGCSVLATPYYIYEKPVGALAILCPIKAPYKRLFAILKTASQAISQSLTTSLQTFKISYREPKMQSLDITHQTALLLEDKTQEESCS